MIFLFVNNIFHKLNHWIDDEFSYGVARNSDKNIHGYITFLMFLWQEESKVETNSDRLQEARDEFSRSMQFAITQKEHEAVEEGMASINLHKLSSFEP